MEKWKSGKVAVAQSSDLPASCKWKNSSCLIPWHASQLQSSWQAGPQFYVET